MEMIEIFAGLSALSIVVIILEKVFSFIKSFRDQSSMNNNGTAEKIHNLQILAVEAKQERRDIMKTMGEIKIDIGILNAKKMRRRRTA